MEKFDGKRVGSAVYVYKKFLYHADARYPGRRFVCINTKAVKPCRASALMHNGVVTITRELNHESNDEKMKKKWAMDALKKLAPEELHLSPRNIMNPVFRE